VAEEPLAAVGAILASENRARKLLSGIVTSEVSNGEEAARRRNTEDIVASEPSDVEEGSLDDDRQSIMSESSIFVVLEGGRGVERAASEVSQEKRQLIVALESRLHGALHFGDDAVTHA
jgi:hypothetical protein